VGARIEPASPFVPPRGTLLHLVATALFVAGCGPLGAEITVDARNEGDLVMRIQVVEGVGVDGRPFGPNHFVDPLEERPVELAVPGGAWEVLVNEQRVFGSVDVAGRTGRLPVTLIVPAPDDPNQDPRWEAPSD
jgi:hypothetical protein